MWRDAARSPWRPRAAVAAIAAIACLSCGDGPSSPEIDPPPADDPIPPAHTDRILTEGTYDVAYTACQACDPGVVPDYLVAFSQGVDGVVTISHADQWTAALRLVEMRQAGDDPEDLIGLFNERVVFLSWNDADAAFRGAVPYGPAADFLPMFKRDGGSFRCDFDILHRKHDVGATTCSVSARAD